MTQPPKRAPNPAEAIFRSTRATHQDVRALHPLLDLLEEGQGTSPIEELKDLLEAVLLSQRQLHLVVEDLSAKVDVLAGRRRLSPSTTSGEFRTRA